MRLRATCLAILVSLSPCMASAEPSTAVKFVMDQKLSLLDWGLYRIERALEIEVNWADGVKGKLSTLASYDWDRNRIDVSSSVLVQTKPTKANARTACRNIVRTQRIMLGVDPDTGRLSNADVTPAMYFLPSSYVLRGEPKDARSELEAIIELVAEVRAFDGNSAPLQARCSGKLFGSETLFAD